MVRILILIIFLIPCFGFSQTAQVKGVKITGARVGFKPTDYPGCILWLESESVTGLDTSTSTNRVTQWTDLSGNGNNATQSTLANEPAYGLTKQNGYKTVRFDAAQRLLFGSTSITNVTNGNDTPYSVFMVSKQDASGNDIAFAWGNSTNAGPLVTFRTFITPNYREIRVDDTGGSSNANISGAGSTSWQLMRFLFSGTSWIGGVNGSATTGNQDVGSITLNVCTIGAFGRNGGFATGFTGDMLALIVYNRQVLTADSLMINNYLNGKYKIY